MLQRARVVRLTDCSAPSIMTPLGTGHYRVLGRCEGYPPPPPRQQATDEGGDVDDSKRNVITTTIMSYGLSPETLALLTSFR